jgi:hypothetical protein
VADAEEMELEDAGCGTVDDILDVVVAGLGGLARELVAFVDAGWVA